MIKKTLVLYGSTRYNPFVTLIRDVLRRYNVPYREIDVDASASIAARLKTWIGEVSVPTLLIAEPGKDEPFEPPTPFVSGQSVRGVDRGSIITAPNNRQLEDWLHKHNFLAKPYQR